MDSHVKSQQVYVPTAKVGITENSACVSFKNEMHLAEKRPVGLSCAASGPRQNRVERFLTRTVVPAAHAGPTSGTRREATRASRARRWAARLC